MARTLCEVCDCEDAVGSYLGQAMCGGCLDAATTLAPARRSQQEQHRTALHRTLGEIVEATLDGYREVVAEARRGRMAVVGGREHKPKPEGGAE